MNPVIVGHFDYPHGEAASVRIAGLARLFHEQLGSPVTIVSLPKKPRLRLRWRIHSYPDDRCSTIGKHLGGARTLKALLRNVVSEGSLVLLYNPGIRLLRALPSRPRYTLVYDIVEHPSYFLGRGGVLSPRFHSKWLSHHLACRRADILGLICRPLHDCLPKAARSKTVLLPPVVDDLPSPPEPPSNKPPRPNIIYLGSLVDREDPTLLFKIVEKLLSSGPDSLHLSIIGRFNRRSCLAPFQSLAASHPKQLSIRSDVPDDELNQLCRQADGFILTRRDHLFERCSFPTRLPELLRFGRPLLVSPVGDIHNYLKESNSFIWIDPKQVEDSCSVFLSSLLDHRATEHLGRASRSVYTQLFKNWKIPDQIFMNLHKEHGLATPTINAIT